MTGSEERRQKIAAAKAASYAALMPLAKPLRDARNLRLAEEHVAREGGDIKTAMHCFDQGYRNVLHPWLQLVFDAREIGTVAGREVLVNPEKFIGKTLADPVEPMYGGGHAKAMVMGVEAGAVVIHSFAHGGRLFQLRYDTDEVFKGVRLQDDPPSPVKFDADWWCERELTLDLPLLGKGGLFATTSRGALSGGTGTGKTHVALAIAAAVATGGGFLHWHGTGKPLDVLYIDGEMPRTHMKRLLHALRARLGGISLKRLHVVSRDDFPALDPLNKDTGRDFILAKVQEIKPALVMFDNVMSLLDGDQREEIAWKATMPLVLELTRMEVCQLWLDHSGHDATRRYGSSTKDWHLDFAILLEKIELPPDATIAAKIKFLKARRRDFENKSDFKEGTILLRRTGWEWIDAQTNGAHKNGFAVPRQLQVAHELFRTACMLEGSASQCQRRTFREACVERSLIDDKENNFNKLVSRLVAAKLIISDRKAQILIDRHLLEPVKC